MRLQSEVHCEEIFAESLANTDMNVDWVRLHYNQFSYEGAKALTKVVLALPAPPCHC